MLVFVSISIVLAGFSSALCVYVAPGAIASGTPELMTFLNGVDYPLFMNWRSLFVKMVGLIFSVSAGLCVGKEGPLAHVGAVIGVGVLYMPFNFLKKYR